MNGYTRIIFYLFLSTFLLQAIGFAEVEKLEFQNRHTVRFALSKNDDHFYLTRAAAKIEYRLPLIERSIQVLPFYEYQSNLDINTWWRKEVGAELGSAFFDDCFYYGASFQHIWQKEGNYTVERLEESTEWESRFVITPPIRWGWFGERLKLRFFDEYTYDFTRGQFTFNEVGATLDWQALDWLRLPLGWRHIDRVHDFDSDILELSVLFIF